MSQIAQSHHRRGRPDLGEETDLFVSIEWDGELDDEAQTAILQSADFYTEEEISLKKFKKDLTPPVSPVSPAPPAPPAPKQKKQLRLSFQSPQLRRRFKSVIESVPGRQQEAIGIFDFLAHSQNGASAPLSLLGNTGCGKTSLITKMMDFYQENSRTVKVAYLNCMSMWSTTHVYKGILAKLFEKRQYDRREKKGQQADTLNKLLSEGKGNGQPTKIIILDEIDQFLNDQYFLYNVLQWLGIGAKLILIFISNIIDITLKLEGKLQSRFRFEAIIFTPYDTNQVKRIIFVKYPEIRTFVQDDAITFVAKKIVNVNSDIRLLQKIYTKLESYHKESGGNLPLNCVTVNSIICEEDKLDDMLTPYAPVLKILNKASKKQEVSRLIIHKLWLQGSRKVEIREVLLILAELQDFGLITLTSLKSCDVSFFDYGIKINQSLRMLYVDEEE